MLLDGLTVVRYDRVMETTGGRVVVSGYASLPRTHGILLRKFEKFTS